MNRFVLLLALSLAGAALAQERKSPPPGKQQLQPQRTRDHGGDAVRGAGRGAPERAQGERQQRMTPQQREKLRQDINEANKNLRR